MRPRYVVELCTRDAEPEMVYRTVHESDNRDEAEAVALELNQHADCCYYVVTDREEGQ